MSKKFEYPCGCQFALTQKENIRHITFDSNINNMQLECSRTWDLISEGNTKGCFQLESRLGRSMAKKLKPSNIEELSALISIMRPALSKGENNPQTQDHSFYLYSDY